MKDSKDKPEELAVDRRDFFAGAAGLAVAALGAGQALAGGHTRAPVPLSEEDKVARPVGEGAVILVTGANRGLGLEFTRQYAQRGARILATARTPEKAEQLNALAEANGKITVEKLDVTDHAAIEALAARYVDQPIDLLLNNAGIGGGCHGRCHTGHDFEGDALGH